MYEFDVVVVTCGKASPFLLWRSSGCAHNAGNRWTIINNTPKPFLDPAEIHHTLGEHHYREFRLRENIGWDKAVNAGIALSTAPFVVLMNDDTEVQTEGWLEKLRQPMLDDPSIGMVGPVTGRAGFQEKQRGKGEVVIAQPEIRLDKYGAGTTPLSFFCVMISRPCLVDVGYMDERFAGSYGCSDDDYQIRAHLRGWKLAVQPSVFVDHVGGATFGSRRAEEQHINEKKIKEKWRERLCES